MWAGPMRQQPPGGQRDPSEKIQDKQNRRENSSLYLSRQHLASSMCDWVQVLMLMLSLMWATFVGKKKTRVQQTFKARFDMLCESKCGHTIKNSPLLGVPLLSAVGVHHPAHVWAQQGPGRVQQRLHQRWWAAVDSHGDQLRGPIGSLHCVSEQAAIWYTPPILTASSNKAWVILIVSIESTLVTLFSGSAYLTGEGQPGFRVGELSEQLNQSFGLFDAGDRLKSDEISSCCC